VGGGGSARGWRVEAGGPSQVWAQMQTVPVAKKIEDFYKKQ